MNRALYLKFFSIAQQSVKKAREMVVMLQIYVSLYELLYLYHD